MDIGYFKKEFERHQTGLEKAAMQFSWEDQEKYLHWLANSFHYVVSSTRLLALAAGCMPAHLTSLSNRFIAHAAEEKGHEKLLVMDLRDFDRRIEDFEVSLEMKFYFRSLYFWVSPASSPIGLLGWVLSLEGLAASIGPLAYDRVRKAYGGKGTKFLKVHSDADPDHLNKALEAVSGLSPDERRLVLSAAKDYANQYVGFLRSIRENGASLRSA